MAEYCLQIKKLQESPLVLLPGNDKSRSKYNHKSVFIHAEHVSNVKLSECVSTGSSAGLNKANPGGSSSGSSMQGEHYWKHRSQSGLF